MLCEMKVVRCYSSVNLRQAYKALLEFNEIWAHTVEGLHYKDATCEVDLCQSGWHWTPLNYYWRFCTTWHNMIMIFFFLSIQLLFWNTAIWQWQQLYLHGQRNTVVMANKLWLDIWNRNLKKKISVAGHKRTDPPSQPLYPYFTSLYTLKDILCWHWTQIISCTTVEY